MATRKRYGAAEEYEAKLDRVMERLGATDVNFNWDRHSTWVEFRYRGELYRFDHDVAKAQESDKNIVYGSDAFAQVVLALEDLARIVNRGIYDFGTWVAGMRFLPAPTEIPECFKVLGFTEMPTSSEVKVRYRNLAKQHHPDSGGDQASFDAIKQAAEKAARHFVAG